MKHKDMQELLELMTANDALNDARPQLSSTQYLELPEVIWCALHQAQQWYPGWSELQQQFLLNELQKLTAEELILVAENDRLMYMLSHCMVSDSLLIRHFLKANSSTHSPST